MRLWVLTKSVCVVSVGELKSSKSVMHVIHAQTGFTPGTIGKIRPLPSAKSSGKKNKHPTEVFMCQKLSIAYNHELQLHSSGA